MEACRDPDTPDMEDWVEQTYMADTTIEPGRVTHHRSYGGNPLRKGFPWISQGQIGSGAYSTVWKQKQEVTGAVRAVKRVQKNNLALNQKKEIVAMARLRQRPQLFVPFRGWYEDDTFVYLAMDNIDLGDLSMHLEPKLDVDDVRMITKQLLQGLEYMHAIGLVHRDLKPQNIFVESRPLWWVKIGDFGIAKRMGNGDTTFTTTPRGTRSYMAPERYDWLVESEEPHQYGQAVDIWALGVVVFQMLTLDLPFGKGSVTVPDYYRGKAEFPEQPLVQNAVYGIAIDFVKTLLTAEPNRRPTAHGAITHSWMLNVQSRYQNTYYWCDDDFFSRHQPRSGSELAHGVTDFGSVYYCVRAMAFSPDGSLLAVGYQTEMAHDADRCEYAQGIVIYDVEASKRICYLNVDNCCALSFSEDGSQLVGFLVEAPREFHLRAWDIVEWNEVWCTANEVEDDLDRLEWTDLSSNMRYLATSLDGCFYVLGLRQRQTSYAHYYNSSLSSNGRRTPRVHVKNGCLLIVDYQNCTIQMWDLTTDAEIAIHGAAISAIKGPSALSPDAQLIVFNSQNTGLTVHDLFNPNHSVTLAISAHTIDEDVTRIVFSPSGRFVATAWEDETITWHDAKTGELIAERRCSVGELACSSDDRFIAYGSRDGFIELWEPCAEHDGNSLTRCREQQIGSRFLDYMNSFSNFVA